MRFHLAAIGASALLALVPACASNPASAAPRPSPAGTQRHQAPATLTAAPAADVRARAKQILGQPQRAPSRDEVRALGSAGYDEFWATWQSAAEPPSARARALTLAGWTGDGRALEALLAVARDAASPTVFRRAAIHGLPGAGADRAREPLGAFLAEISAEVRDAAARALGELQGPETRKLLESQLARETDLQVRSSLERSLKEQKPPP